MPKRDECETKPVSSELRLLRFFGSLDSSILCRDPRILAKFFNLVCTRFFIFKFFLTGIFCWAIERDRSLFMCKLVMKTNTFEKLPETRQMEILHASAIIFAEKGYFQAGIVEICQTTGISNGALYKYF